MTASRLVRRKAVWIAPVVIGVVLIGLMTTLYLGSAVDPIDHMHGLPVSLVEEDQPPVATLGGVIRALSKLGYESMFAQQEGPVLLVGHSYGGAVITEADDLPNVIGLVYIAAFAPDAGESLAIIGEAFDRRRAQRTWPPTATDTSGSPKTSSARVSART